MLSNALKSLRIALPVVMIAALPAPGPAMAQEPEETEVQVHVTQVDTSAFPTVTVYVSVTDAAGEPLGVDPQRILIREEGRAIQPDRIQGLGQVESPTTLLMFDVSGSMNEAGKLDRAKEAARTYVELMRPGDRVGLMAFDTEVHYVQPFTADQDALLQAIDDLHGVRDTAMYDALVEGIGTLEAVSGRKAIIVLTDGMDTRSEHTLEEVIERIGPSGLSISTVGLGDPQQVDLSWKGLDVEALEALADRAGGSFAYADDSEELTRLYARYARALQSEYAVTYTTPSRLRDGVTRQLTVSLAEAGASAEGAAYNPGGLLPEVGEVASWTSFFIALAALAVLLLLPGAVRRAFSLFGARTAPGAGKRKPRVKLKDPPKPRTRLR